MDEPEQMPTTEDAPIISVDVSSEDAPAVGTRMSVDYVAQDGDRGMAELTDHQPPTRPADPPHLGQGGGRIVGVAQPEGDRHGVEGLVGERQRQGVSGHERQIAPASSTDGQHAQREVTRDHVGSGVGQRD